MATPASPMRVAGAPVDTIEILFELPVGPDVASIVAQQTFVVRSQPSGLPVLTPQIIFVPRTNAVRFFVARPLLPGSYAVRLTDGVTATSGERLDGEFPVSQWPSGDGAQGGDFEFVLEIT